MSHRISHRISRRSARSRLVALVTAALTGPLLALAGLPGVPDLSAPAHAGVGSWTRISSGTVVNFAEPGTYRTPDGVLHIVYQRAHGTNSDLAFTNLSSTGAVLATGTAVGNWATLPADPKLIAGPAGGLRLVYGGLRTTDSSDPYATGQMYSSTSDSAGTSWTLQPGALTGSHSAYGSYGTGATTLADGTTPAVSFPLNSTLTWNTTGAGSGDGTYDFGRCCVYHSTLVRNGSDLWAAYAANGSDAAHAGVFVQRLAPTLGAPTKAPASSQGVDLVMSVSEATPFLARPGGGMYLAYCLGYPTCTGVGLWRLGTSAPVTVPGAAGATHLALAAGPHGRLWVAWSVPGGLIRITHTTATGSAFGAVTTIKAPTAAGVYGISLAASDGSTDVLVNTGDALYDQQVLPGLSLRAAPLSWKHTTRKKVSFTVTDAGVAVAGASVTAAGRSCTTSTAGSCRISFKKTKRKGSFRATARHSGYAAGTVQLKRR